MTTNTFPASYAPIQFDVFLPIPPKYPFRFTLEHVWTLDSDGSNVATLCKRPNGDFGCPVCLPTQKKEKPVPKHKWTRFAGFGISDLVISYYDNNRIAIQLFTNDGSSPEPLARMTVNLPDQPLDENCIFVKDYAENEGATRWLVRNLIIEPKILSMATSGYITACSHRLTPWFIETFVNKPTR